MPTNVPINQKIDNLKYAEIWPAKFLMFNFKRIYLFCPSSDFNDLGIKTQVRSCFIVNKKNFENQTIGFCSIVCQTSGAFVGHLVASFYYMGH